MIKNFILNNFPSLIKFIIECKFRFKNNWKKPEVIHLDNGLRLFADWNEPRGRSLIIGGAKGQPSIKQFWKKAGELILPDVFLDVGANYGEVMFSTNYHQNTKLIIGVEANSSLIKFLNKTLDANPYKEKVILLNKLASDSTGQIERFFIDKKSSGRSTALENNFVKDVIEVNVESIRLDDFILAHLSSIQSMVFKIDVEGFEPYVLRGLEKLIQKRIKMIGCIEINLVSLKNNNCELGFYFKFLNDHFNVGIFHNDGRLELLAYINEDVLRKKVKNKHVETDLILYTSDIDINNLFRIFKE
ncbi:MAG: FkbM family methyltransferase [Saprospiraceae bacterium]